MTILLAYAETVRETGRLFAPAGAAEIGYIDPHDVAEVAAATLITGEHEGCTYALTGPEAITYEQIARDLSAATGRRIDYVNVPDEHARQAMLEAGLPAIMADTIVAVYASQRAGSQALTTSTVKALTGRRPRTFAEFARDHAGLFGAAVPTGSRS